MAVKDHFLPNMPVMGKPLGYHLFFAELHDMETIQNWVDENCQGASHVLVSPKATLVCLYDDKDAMLFKLSW